MSCVWKVRETLVLVCVLHMYVPLLYIYLGYVCVTVCSLSSGSAHFANCNVVYIKRSRLSPGVCSLVLFIRLRNRDYPYFSHMNRVTILVAIATATFSGQRRLLLLA